MTRIPVHKRSIDIEIFDDEQGFTVLGHLTDRRPWHDEPARQVLHDMTIELGIDPATLTITSATSQMSAFPHAECPLVTTRFGNLVGSASPVGTRRHCGTSSAASPVAHTCTNLLAPPARLWFRAT